MTYRPPVRLVFSILMASSLKDLLLGKPKDPLDPRVFHQISLVAFLAWVGLGADGLSSSAYGPEEAYLALGEHFFLALPLAMLMAATVFIISASYSHIIELFPTGGGGYLVATKLLGPKVGLISGCALVVDYMLTITISVASAGDQIFSFLPASVHGAKLATEFVLIFLLIYLNLRGTKESVLFLLPIFLLFVVAHLFAIGLGAIPNAASIPALASGAYQKTLGDIQGLGLWATLFLILHAYSLGGGTYTGIEAVSNGLQALREPRVETGKKTMLYMATSLAFTAALLLAATATLVGGVTFGFDPLQFANGLVTQTVGDLLIHTAIATFFVFWTLSSVIAFGFMLSTMTESAAAAAGAALGFGVVAEILDAISSLGRVRDGLPFRYFEAWHDLFVFGKFTDDMWKGLLLPVPYVVLFCTFGWWWFRRKDITD